MTQCTQGQLTAHSPSKYEAYQNQYANYRRAQPVAKHFNIWHAKEWLLPRRDRTHPDKACGGISPSMTSLFMPKHMADAEQSSVQIRTGHLGRHTHRIGGALKSRPEPCMLVLVPACAADPRGPPPCRDAPCGGRLRAHKQPQHNSRVPLCLLNVYMTTAVQCHDNP
eukprot:350255-Chlamydomonas_euryale.AAC.9